MASLYRSVLAFLRARRLFDVASGIEWQASGPSSPEALRAARLYRRVLRLAPAELPTTESTAEPDGSGSVTLRDLARSRVRWSELPCPPALAPLKGRRGAAIAIALALVILGWRPASDLFSRNLAAHATWRASSAYPGFKIDGMPPGDSGPFFFHTREEATPSVTIDLGRVFPITRVVVINRRDGLDERAVPLVLEVSRDGTRWSEMGRKNLSFSTWETRFDAVGGRYLRLRVDRQSLLHLAEIRVY